MEDGRTLTRISCGVCGKDIINRFVKVQHYCTDEYTRREKTEMLDIFTNDELQGELLNRELLTRKGD